MFEDKCDIGLIDSLDEIESRLLLCCVCQMIASFFVFIMDPYGFHFKVFCFD